MSGIEQKAAKAAKIYALPELDLNLEIFLLVRDPRAEYPDAVIAEVCGCSRALIWQLRRRALGKMRRELMRRAVLRGDIDLIEELERRAI